jgi:hypothetical protein
LPIDAGRPACCAPRADSMAPAAVDELDQQYNTFLYLPGNVQNFISTSISFHGFICSLRRARYMYDL